MILSIKCIIIWYLKCMLENLRLPLSICSHQNNIDECHAVINYVAT